MTLAGTGVGDRAIGVGQESPAVAAIAKRHLQHAVRGVAQHQAGWQLSVGRHEPLPARAHHELRDPMIRIVIPIAIKRLETLVPVVVPAEGNIDAAVV